MTHFTVIVRLPGATQEDELGDALSAILAPFQENNMGDCPKQYLEFHDTEDEYLNDYENDSVEMIRCEDGSLAYAWDERFRVPGEIGLGSGTHKVPDHLERVQVKHRERYSTFEEFVADWHSSKERDPEKNRFGYWENPNKKWDYWRAYPLFENYSSGPGEFVRKSSLNMESITIERDARVKSFFEKYQRLIAGEKLDYFESPRSRAIDIGLIEIRRSGINPREEDRAISWSKFIKDETDQRREWFDVFKVLTVEELLRDHAAAFLPIRGYAFLDETGWHAPGRMGWWASSDDTPDTYKAYCDDFQKWITESLGDSWFVAVDCHI